MNESGLDIEGEEKFEVTELDFPDLDPAADADTEIIEVRPIERSTNRRSRVFSSLPLLFRNL